MKPEETLPAPTPLKLESIGLKFKDESTEEFKSIVTGYFSVFAEPSGRKGDGFSFGNKCINCGEHLMGMLGTFQWSICYGEFRCSKCGWPGRGCHSVKDKAGEELFSFGDSCAPVALQYLPEFVTRQAESEEAKENE